MMMKTVKMEKRSIPNSCLNIETLRKDKQMTWEERMNYLMPKMNIGVQKEFLEEIQIETETTPPKKTLKRNRAPEKRKDKENHPLTSTALYLTQTDLQAVRTPDVSLIPKSSKAKKKREDLFHTPRQLTISRPEFKNRHLTSTPNCSRKEQLEIDLSVIQPPTQEDELDIHSSTLVNSMEIAAPEDSVELPPPLDIQQVLELNQKSKEKKKTFVKPSEDHVKSKVANVLTKHGELFQFKSKVTEILHKAGDFANIKKALDNKDNDKNNDFEDDMLEEIDEDHGQSISDRKHKISDKLSEEKSVSETNQDKDPEVGANDVSAIHSEGEPLHDLSQTKQRRLTYKDLSIHKELEELQPESDGEQGDLTALSVPNTSVRRKSRALGKKAKRSTMNKTGPDFCSSPVKHRESVKRNSPYGRLSGKYKHALESGKRLSSQVPGVFKPVTHDDLCSWRQMFRKSALIRKHTYPRTSASSNPSVDDILINFLNVTC